MSTFFQTHWSLNFFPVLPLNKLLLKVFDFFKSVWFGYVHSGSVSQISLTYGLLTVSILPGDVTKISLQTVKMDLFYTN